MSRDAASPQTPPAAPHVPPLPLTQGLPRAHRASSPRRGSRGQRWKKRRRARILPGFEPYSSHALPPLSPPAGAWGGGAPGRGRVSQTAQLPPDLPGSPLPGGERGAIPGPHCRSGTELLGTTPPPVGFTRRSFQLWLSHSRCSSFAPCFGWKFSMETHAGPGRGL